ncbi:hypothetical protein XacyCFBP2565_05595 [Xanthomonas arboricola pv. corylina]|nr:hypothetical protein XacyCFBP2565_05595 [Xanthomonas arboricola pv. corylina]
MDSGCTCAAQQSTTNARRAISSSYASADHLSGAVSSPLAGPLAAWMPPRSLHGRIHGVSRKW